MEEKTLYIRILSPVHVGCDEVYDPTGFIINEDAATLTAFEPMDFFRSLNAQDKSRYAAICSKGTIESILELYKFMRGKHLAGHIVGACKGLIAHYQRTLSMSLGDRRRIQQELNNFSISRTAFNPTTQKPYIPGSAIKGALRTAYLNRLAKTKSVTVDRRDRNPANALEKQLLQYQSLEKDPFRLLKVSDFHPVGPCPTKIVYAVNAKKMPSRFDARGPFQILEIIQPGTVFTGSIQALNPLAHDIIKTPLSKEKILESAAAFYTKEKKREDEELAGAGLPVGPTAVDSGICPLRIGRHSGAESLTIEGYRHIKIMKRRGERPDFGAKATTFWLASETSESRTAENLQPFGWASLGMMTASLQEELAALAAKQQSEEVSAEASQVVKAQIEEKKVMPPPPAEEVWENAFASFNPGGGGIVSVQFTDKRKAEIHGKEKAMAATDAGLHKKLFDGKKTLPKARITVRKAGNNWEIIKIEPTA